MREAKGRMQTPGGGEEPAGFDAFPLLPMT